MFDRSKWVIKTQDPELVSEFFRSLTNNLYSEMQKLMCPFTYKSRIYRSDIGSSLSGENGFRAL